jgi:PAS domain S-box-containing protein
VAPDRDTNRNTPRVGEAATIPEMGPELGRERPFRPFWRRDLSLRARLFLLVLASVVPLTCMGLVMEYLDYRAGRQEVYAGLLQTARGMSVAVERDLQVRLSSLEALATSPALQTGDWSAFDAQANAFLKRQSPGTLLGLSGLGAFAMRVYGLPADGPQPLQYRDPSFAGNRVFETGRPLVTNLHVGHTTGLIGFSIDVPVFLGDHVAFDMFLRLLPQEMADLIARQHLSPGTLLTIVDGNGKVVARVPEAKPFLGGPIVPELWNAVRERAEGTIEVPTLEGRPAVAAYTRVEPFSWTVIVGSTDEEIFGPIRMAIARVGIAGASVLLIGLLLAKVAAQGITGPIEHLRRLAAADDAAEPVATGLPEADTVARALVTAAAERQASARALAESEARFRLLFEKSASGTILLEPETTRIVDCNDVAAAIVGYSVDELRNRLITEFALQTRPTKIHAICQSVAGGASLRYETRIQGRHGPRDVLVAVAPVQVEGRTLVLLNQIDITDLRRAEAGLRVNEERLELAGEGANLGIWDWDVVQNTVTWSDRQWQLHGLEPGACDPTIEDWANAINKEDLQRTRNEIVAALKTPDRPFATEYGVTIPDGSVRRLLARGQTIRDDNGRVIRMIGINMDVTARYEAEVARDRLIWMLEMERARLLEIFEALPVGIGIVEPDGRVILGNAAMNRLNGPVIQSMTAAPRGEWIAYLPDGRRVAPEDFPMRRALRLGETTLPGIDFLYRDADGNDTWFRVASMPLRWEDGQVQEALGIFQDIDAEKRLLDIREQTNLRLEQRVRQEIAAREAAQQRAAHAERMHALGQIAGGIAHDFNNVLQAVSGGAALIERRPHDAERALRNARMVLDAARRGAAITSRLLAFSRRGDLRAENVDAYTLLTDMAEVLTHTLGGSVVCVVDVVPGLPPMFVDRGQLETVLVNLATNARDAMPQGGTVTLSADAEIASAALPHPAGLLPGRYIRIQVSDTGTGMDQAILARVTEPFFTTKEPGKGTGLGLAMAKGFVEQSGGSLSIDSVVGQGARIILWLPITAGPVATGQGDIARRPGDSRKPRVLLVDDDPIVRDVLRLSLEDAGYAVLPVESGPLALALLDAGEHVDIIVTDLTMPAMDGLAVIRGAQERRPNLPAVLLTGYAGDGAALAVGGAISGAFSLLRKPVSGSQLVDRISALLASSKQPSSA